MPQGTRVQAEYVWIGGTGQDLRCKTRTLEVCMHAVVLCCLCMSGRRKAEVWCQCEQPIVVVYGLCAGVLCRNLESRGIGNPKLEIYTSYIYIFRERERERPAVWLFQKASVFFAAVFVIWR